MGTAIGDKGPFLPWQPFPRIMTEAELQQRIRNLIHKSERRRTPADLQKLLSCDNREAKKSLRGAIRTLIDQKELMYVTEFGHTFLVAALNKPVRLSNRVVLKPEGCRFGADSRDIVINFQHGVAFGGGQHPTTRLCLKGLEELIKLCPNLTKESTASALDIGTGSGILIIAAVQMGLKRGVGIDVDPISISEAKKNVQINTLNDRISISLHSFESIKESFNLIMANLRWPTLNSYLPKMIQNMNPDGVLLLSGIQSQELDALVELGERNQLNLMWQEKDKGWAAVGFSK
jgi:ribosomal protein L11 methyltransferase